MFDKNELNQLREVVIESVGQALEDIVLPRFEKIDERFDKIEGRIGKIESTMVTQDFLEKRLTDFRVNLTDSADWVGRQLKRLTHTMYQGKLLTADQLIEIHAK